MGAAVRSQVHVLVLALLAAMYGIDPCRADETQEFDPSTGYRIARYRTPTFETVPGGTRITIDELDRLVAQERAVMIDVMPSDGAGLDHKSGTWHIRSALDHIPQSIWLPDVGRGTLDARLDTYFRSNLESLTEGDKARAVIIYCQSDCWMGWNAVKRAASYGYTSIYWYPDGIDGWRDWDRAFTPAVPVPAKPST